MKFNNFGNMKFYKVAMLVSAMGLFVLSVLGFASTAGSEKSFFSYFNNFIFLSAFSFLMCLYFVSATLTIIWDLLENDNETDPAIRCVKYLAESSKDFSHADRMYIKSVMPDVLETIDVIGCDAAAEILIKVWSK